MGRARGWTEHRENFRRWNKEDEGITRIII